MLLCPLYFPCYLGYLSILFCNWCWTDEDDDDDVVSVLVARLYLIQLYTYPMRSWCSKIDVIWKPYFDLDICFSRNLSFLPYFVISRTQVLIRTHLAITEWPSDMASLLALGSSSTLSKNSQEKFIYWEWCDDGYLKSLENYLF